MSPRAFFLLAATYTLAAVMGWCVIAVLSAVWWPKW
jgi:hypothetical protein